MKINKAYRPELLVSKGKEPNPLLTDPYLDVKENLLVATEGHALVALPVETEKGERSRYLACSLLKAARILGDKDVPAEIKDQEVVEFGVLWPTAQERSFPPWVNLRPKLQAGDEGTITLALNARLLRAISEAMAVDEVRLTVELGRSPDDPGPILVRPTQPDSEEMGLLMPLRGSGEATLGPGQVCPVCRRILAAGAACPEHGDRKAIEDAADAILRNAGAGELTKKDTKGEAVARKGKRRG